MKNGTKLICVLLAWTLLVGWPAAANSAAETTAQTAVNSIDNLQVSQQSGSVMVKITLKQPLANPPGSFSISNPARIALDFPGTVNGLGRTAQTYNEGDLRSVNIVQAGERTRVVLNLSKLGAFDTRLEGNALLITLLPREANPSKIGSPLVSHFADSNANAAGHNIRNINFRRGKDGEARIVVDLSDNTTGIDIRQQGGNLIVDFLKTSIASNLARKLDVTDFSTPVTSVSALKQGDNVRMVVTPKGLWEHNAYQSDNQFVLEVKRVIEDPNKLVQGSRGRYQGEKLSLNFQNIDVRAVLQVIADFTNFNIITSDTVSGSLTLRLKDVPWDQALDIVLQAKGLDMRKNGNVIWIAPRDEIATREKIQLESRQQIGDLEPLQTESFQLNYHKAKSVFDFLKNKDQTVLSKRGTVISDERTNKVFVTDVPSRLEDLRKLVAEIDVPVRQVLIEARIVEAEDTFARTLGARFGITGSTGGPSANSTGRKLTFSGNVVDSGYMTGQIATKSDFLKDALSSNLRAASINGAQAGQFGFSLFNTAATRVLNLEISALEADGVGKVIAS
ncbi:MAG: type IV pilus secretin PilQ, partial [Rhodocyclaceae bacterium]